MHDRGNVQERLHQSLMQGGLSQRNHQHILGAGWARRDGMRGPAGKIGFQGNIINRSTKRSTEKSGHYRNPIAQDRRYLTAMTGLNFQLA